MKIDVCVKQVPASNETRLDPVTHTIIRDSAGSVLNPFDAYAVEEALRIRERRGGTVKAFSMGIPAAAEMLRRVLALGVDDALLITDRTDLDDQLSGQMLSATGFIGDNMIRQVENRAQLGEYLQGRTSGGVFLTTIQKFTEETGLLSDRTNIIYMTHRTLSRSQGLLEILKQCRKPADRSESRFDPVLAQIRAYLYRFAYADQHYGFAQRQRH